APKIDLAVKYNGGNNAGHTVVVQGEKYTLHLLPSGILWEHVTPILGNGMVIDLPTLFQELQDLINRGVNVSKLVVSAYAHVIMPYHKTLDAALENDPTKQKIGTTKRGIGPTYADKIARSGIRVADLFDPLELEQKIGRALVSKNAIFQQYDLPTFTVNQVVMELIPYINRLKPMVKDVPWLVHHALKDSKSVLFEGGQATMLDVDFGTYPYVTSSNATAGGALTGSGVGPTEISSVIGISKAYCTRVGEGPFPTEIFGQTAQIIRKRGSEYGATTQRPRRIGWFDAVVAEYASRINGLTDIVLTKLDILSDLDEIPVCVGYRILGKNKPEHVVSHLMPMDMNLFENVVPEYHLFPGWTEDIQNIRDFKQLPSNCRDYVLALEELSHCRISLIGVGPERDQVIVRHDF
ncbi:MAG: adenylosuccinate synthase, partial [Bifidobacteriaceae bacterium]|nr:adenylosuccinate synthase [Bifidobacteriaceae bacterium]